MAILRKLPAAVAVAALTATLVGCGSNEIREERDQARMDLGEAQTQNESLRTENQNLTEAADAAEKRQTAIDGAKQALMMAKNAVMALAAAATDQDRLNAEMAVVTAAKAAVMTLQDNDGSDEEIAAAMEAVTEYETMVEATEMRIAEAKRVTELMARRMRPLELEGPKARMALSDQWEIQDAVSMNAEERSGTDRVELGYYLWQLQDPTSQFFDLDGSVNGDAEATDTYVSALVADETTNSDDNDNRLFTVSVSRGSGDEAPPTISVVAEGQRPDTATGSRALVPEPFTSTAIPKRGLTETLADYEKRRKQHMDKLDAMGAYKDAPMIDGWTSAMYARRYVKDEDSKATVSTRDDVTVTDMVTVYTNAGGPESTGRYWDYYVESITGSAATDKVESVRGGDAPPDANTLQRIRTGGGYSLQLRIPTGSEEAVPQPGAKDSFDDRTHPLAGFPTNRDQNITYTDHHDANFAGTYYGMPGQYKCGHEGDLNTCRATTDASGALSLAGDWVFTPSVNANPRTLIVPTTGTTALIPDRDLMTFGYWLETTVDTRSRTSYMVGVFNKDGALPSTGLRVDQNQDGIADDLSSITTNKSGSATYEGPAAGLFTRRAYDPEGGGTVEVAGRFTADASLTADFDTSDLDIDGTINNFMRNGEEVIDPAWDVSMSEGDIDPRTGRFSSNYANQDDGDGSVWQGTFHGHYTADNMDTPIDETELLPTGVSGTFSNTFDNGAVLGAFGATQQ